MTVSGQSPDAQAGEKCRGNVLLPAIVVGILVSVGFAFLVKGSRSYAWPQPASNEPYNLMVQGFREGHVWLAKAAPPELLSAPNPYAFAAYRPYLGAPWNLTDLSYYRGHLYAYFGVAPAALVFWPWRALTGTALHQAYAVFFFCFLGYAVSTGLAIAAWLRYFPQAGRWAGASIALLLGSVTTLPVFLVRPGLYEVSISCAFACAMASLAALWNCRHRRRWNSAWLALASLFYGLAIASRPPLFFGAAILLLPVAAAFLARQKEGAEKYRLQVFLAAVLPISVVGAAIAAYNFLRFGDPLQFGHAYQLTGYDVSGSQAFGLQYFWDNVRLYFTEPVRWHSGFPYVWKPASPPLGPKHLPVEFFFGTLSNLPILLAAGLVPLACSHTPFRRSIGGILVALLILFFAGALPICLYAGATSRYLLDFVPALALLASLGFLGAGQWRAPAAPALLGVLYGAVIYSSAVVWLLAVALSGFYRASEDGLALLNSGRIGDGIVAYERACRLNPDFKAQAELAIGSALLRTQRAREGIGYLRSAIEDDPGLAAAHLNLARALLEQGRFKESADLFRRAAALDPFDGEAEADLGVALFKLGLVGDAIEHEKTALRIEPTLTEARRNLEALEAAGPQQPLHTP